MPSSLRLCKERHSLSRMPSCVGEEGPTRRRWQRQRREKQRTVRVRSSVERHCFNKIRCTTGICGRWQHLARIPSYDDEIKWWKRMKNSSQMTKQKQKREEEVRIGRISKWKFSIHIGVRSVATWFDRTRFFSFSFLLILKRIKNCTNFTPLLQIYRYEPYSCQHLPKNNGEFGRFTSTDMNVNSSRRPQNLYAYSFSFFRRIEYL